jgi:hypothetical protein
MNPEASGKGKKPVSSLIVAGGAKTDGTQCPCVHIVAMLFMRLGVRAEFGSNVLVEIKVLASEKVSGGQSAGCAIAVREGIEPEHRVGNQSDDH